MAETNRIVEKINRDYQSALKVYKVARDFRRAGTEVATQLPDFLTSINWYTFRQDGENQFYLETWVLEEDEGDILRNGLKHFGAYGMTPKFNSTNHWCYSCTIMVGENEVKIVVDGGSKPPECRIEEFRETREVITYKAICPETGEEL